jgi:sulfonate transport system ATP-binding protein
MDEPYSALDALTRHDLQEHLLSLWVDQQPTLILVTHDIEEALFLADQVVVLQSQPGRVKSSFPIHLERPRQREDTLFLQWRSRLLKELDHANRVSETSSGPVTRQHQTTAVG